MLLMQAHCSTFMFTEIHLMFLKIRLHTSQKHTVTLDIVNIQMAPITAVLQHLANINHSTLCHCKHIAAKEMQCKKHSSKQEIHAKVAN